MGRVGIDSQPCGQPSTDGPVSPKVADRRGTSQFMGPQAETLDRLMGRTEAELGAAKTRRGWSLFSILRAAYQTRKSDPKR